MGAGLPGTTNTLAIEADTVFHQIDSIENGWYHTARKIRETSVHHSTAFVTATIQNHQSIVIKSKSSTRNCLEFRVWSRTDVDWFTQ